MWSDSNPNFIGTHNLHRTQTHKPPSTQKNGYQFLAKYAIQSDPLSNQIT